MTPEGSVASCSRSAADRGAARSRAVGAAGRASRAPVSVLAAAGGAGRSARLATGAERGGGTGA